MNAAREHCDWLTAPPARLGSGLGISKYGDETIHLLQKTTYIIPEQPHNRLFNRPHYRLVGCLCKSSYGWLVAKTTNSNSVAHLVGCRPPWIHLSRLVHEQDALAERLQVSLRSRPVLTANEKAVVNLSGEVKTETDNILRILSQFKLASAGQNCFKRSMHSAKTAFKIHSKKQAVEDHRKKLQLVNGQLAVALLSVLRYGLA